VNRKVYVLISIFLATISGWGLGYIRLPYIEKEYSFEVGVLTAIAILSLSTFLTHLLKTKNTLSSSKYSKKSFWLILTCITTAAVCIILYQQNHTQQNKIETQGNLIAAQSEAIIALEQRNLMALVATVLSAADIDLAQSSTRSLSQATIDRIVDLSHSLKPYRQVTKDSIVSRKLSKERGQLLLSLAKMNINSASFAIIKKMATFEYADLRDAHLANMDLSGINLSRANLEGAKLSNTNLNSANLQDANIMSAQMESSSFIKANLTRANLDWSDMKYANITKVKLDGASLKRANLQYADISESFIIHSSFKGANLTSSIFTNTYIDTVDLSQTNFTNANLVDIRIRRADLTDAIFLKAIVNEDWFVKLDEDKIIGIKELKSSYTVEKLHSKSTEPLNFLLEAKRK
jgi:uncharacterized protein YjbI with pentapeptide repeats